MRVSQNSKVKQKRTFIYLFLGHMVPSPFCVDELFWLIVSFRIVMGVYNRMLIV